MCVPPIPVRIAVVALGMAVLIGSPLLYQIYGYEDQIKGFYGIRTLFFWTMFGHMGQDACLVRLWSNGTEVRPRGTGTRRRMSSKEAVDTYVSRICRQHKHETVNVEAVCGAKEHGPWKGMWKYHANVEADACSPSSTHRRRSKGNYLPTRRTEAAVSSTQRRRSPSNLKESHSGVEWILNERNVRLVDAVGTTLPTLLVLAYSWLFLKTSWDEIVSEEKNSPFALCLLRACCSFIAWAEWGDLFYRDLWMRPVSDGEFLRPFVCATFFLFSATNLLGILPRVSLLGLAWSMIQVNDSVHNGTNSKFKRHHTRAFAGTMMVLAATPCGRALTVFSRSPKDANLWAVPLLRLHMSCIYFFATLDKLDSRWLSGDRMEQVYVLVLKFTPWARDVPFSNLEISLMQVASVLGILSEGLLAVGVLIRGRFLIPTLAFGIVFHAMIFILFPVKSYSCIMWSLFLIVPPADKVARWAGLREVPSAQYLKVDTADPELEEAENDKTENKQADAVVIGHQSKVL